MENDKSKSGGLRVSRLQAVDFMRIEEIDLKTTGKALVILRGPNEAGKTSGMDALKATLAGARAMPEEPVRKRFEFS